MNRGIYATATGMMAAQTQLDCITNNLANANTTGYKRDAVAFSEGLERQLRANGGKGQVLGTLGSGSVQQSQFTEFDAGALNATGNPLDLTVLGDKGLFAVKTEQGIRYTRDGSFTLNSENQLVTQRGGLVLDDRLNPITIDGGKPSVQSDGTIFIDGKEAGKLGIFEGSFQKVGDNLYESTDAKATDEIQVKAGHLEGSNVNAIEAMTDMITLNRAFELAQRSIQQQDDLTQRLIQSLQDR
jgi:flagellar basal-body rod protein FlgF